jgi:heme o synthase
MKIEEALAPPLEVPKAEAGLLSDLMALTKARLTAFVLLTTFVGFWLGSDARVNFELMIQTLLGTGLVAASAAILNQVMEVSWDRLMHRTRERPIPAGRMRISTACALGTACGGAGLAYLWIAVNALSAILAGITLFIYLAVYTPLKRRTPWCVIVGAVSGAIPPVIGWAAADPSLPLKAWILFGVLFFWQIPHFLAIAWMYRDEYAQAGFVMLRRRDVSGSNAAFQSLTFSVALMITTLIPMLTGDTRPWYGVAALLVNSVMLVCATRFTLHRSRTTALQLFFASVIYLPMVLALMVFMWS